MTAKVLRVSSVARFICSVLILLGKSRAFTSITKSRSLARIVQGEPPLFTSTTRLFSSSADTTKEWRDTNGGDSTNNQLPGVSLQEHQASPVPSISATALANMGIVAACGAVAGYGLLWEKLNALYALWDYGLGPHTPEVTMPAIAADLLTRMPMDALHAYETLVPTNPVFFKACTSGVAYALGDFLSQIYQGKTWEDLDLLRSFRSGAAGFISHGPLCHFWLLFMETYLDFNGAWWATGIKVTADLTVWSIFLSAAYSTIIGLLALRAPQDVFRDVRATTWPALRSAWRFWPFVHTVSFSHAVPLDLKLLWVDVMEVVWVTILSKVNNEDKDQKFKEENGDSPTAVKEDGVREVFMKVLAACWPLIAMWPVLYMGYQAERALGLV